MWGGGYACGAELRLCVNCACLWRCSRAHAPLCCAAATAAARHGLTRPASCAPHGLLLLLRLLRLCHTD